MVHGSWLFDRQSLEALNRESVRQVRDSAILVSPVPYLVLKAGSEGSHDWRRRRVRLAYTPMRGVKLSQSSFCLSSSFTLRAGRTHHHESLLLQTPRA